MKSRLVISLAVVVAAVVSGCVVDNPTAYDSCKSAKDCTGARADTCVPVTQNWGGSYGYGTDNICTTGCTTDSGCSLSANGRAGFCSTAAILGAAAGTCFERCYYDTDCSAGFLCRGAADVYGLPGKELICVPEPDAVPPPLKATYEWCNSLSECDTYSSRCEQLDPKWTTTTASFQLNICTVTCAYDADCPTSFDGEPGFCDVYSQVAATPVCIERCDVANDCLAGFVCAPMSTISGLPNSPSDSICVPDPNW